MARVKIDQPFTMLGSVDKNGNVQASQGLLKWMTDVWRRMGADTDFVDTSLTNAATASTSAAAAATQANLSGHTVLGMNFVWHTDATGTQPPNLDTRDLVVTIYDESNTAIATRTLRGTYATATDTIAVTAQSTTGEATTFTLIADGTASVQAIVTHTASGAKGSLSWTFVDETIAGSLPVSGAGK